MVRYLWFQSLNREALLRLGRNSKFEFFGKNEFQSLIRGVLLRQPVTIYGW